MIPDENVDPQKEMKNIRNCKDVGKYRILKKKAFKRKIHSSM